MSAIEHTYERIMAYLKGLLSNRQRHNLEREMMHDAFDDEAFEGLGLLSANELESDMDALMARLEKRTQPAKIRKLTVILRLAAAIVLLAGIGSILYLVFRTPSQSLITEELSREKLEAPAETAAPAVPEQHKIATPEPEHEKSSRDIIPPKQVTRVVMEEAALFAASESDQVSVSAPVSESTITDSVVIMQEDLRAMEEVIVVQYDAKKKSDAAGAVLVNEADKSPAAPESASNDLTRPVPPGGSLEIFKDRVEKQLDYSKYREFQGKNRVQVTLTVLADGTVRGIEIKAPAPGIIAEDLKRIIAQSSPWQPALKNKSPVESQIVIWFEIMIE